MKTMIAYIKILIVALFISLNISCVEDDTQYSEEFFYGIWDEIESPQNLAFYYALGFEFKKDGVCHPRHYSDGEFVTADYAGSWNYSNSKKEITFTEDGSKFPGTYKVEILSNDQIKLINPYNDAEFIYERQ